MTVTRWARGRTADLLVAAATTVVFLGWSAAVARPQDRPLWPGGAVLIVLMCGIWALRRRHPVLVVAVVTLAVPLYYPMGYPDGPVALVLLPALFNAATRCRLAVPLGAVIVVNCGFVVVGVLRSQGRLDDREAVVNGEAVGALGVVLLVTVGMGQYVRARRAELAAAERRAAEAERDREAEARRRATEERLRIARELHDVLAHQISLIHVQAGAALHRRDDADQAYASLEAIKQASKDTLRELRAVLGVLRHVDDTGPSPASSTTPPAPPAGTAGTAGAAVGAPSLELAGQLVARTRAAGLAVRLTGDTDPEFLGSLPAPVSAAGYRIVQEALTNVVRHAHASSATVRITRADGAVVLQVDDDGAGPCDPAALERGNGLRGMRERAAAVGGRVSAEPGPSGGFRVHARLPLPHAPATDDQTGDQTGDMKENS
ncbi:sensor histidine kinase [Actinomadura miaoliensis]|uniref:sensor histidine kinase n=1 Tax=Actinomadura miaoliensis TaxID=430685 RepID=UPI0031ED8489